MKKINTTYFSLLMMLFLGSTTLPSYGQNCTFDDPQKQAEYDALVDIYIANPTSRISQDFEYRNLVNGVDCNVCNLFRVTCNSSGYIQGLLLYNRALRTIPESIGNLSSLETLNIGDNFIAILPERISDLTSLTELQLFDNEFISLPESIGNLSNLTVLKLHDNKLISLPEAIGNLNSLQEITLYDNQLTSLPDNIGNLSNFEKLDFSLNQLTSVPEIILNSSSLGLLNLSSNQLTSLPNNIGNLSALYALNLGNNQLTSLPESIGDLSNLENLLLNGNDLTSLPESIGNLNRLRELSLNGNQLTALPENIDNLSSLTNLSLSDNQLTSLPESIGNLSILTSLMLYNNQLTSLPENFGNLSNLKTIYIFNNELSSLPESFGNLNSVDHLRIGNNQLTSLPESFGNLNTLLYLWLDDNQLTTLPENFGNLSNLQELLLRENQLTSLPKSIGNLSSLESFRFNSNQINCFPEEILALCLLFQDPHISFFNNPIASRYVTFADFCENPADGLCSDSGDGTDPYLTGNTGNEPCSVWIDSDDDGVCDDADVCEGGDDYIDTNGNGIPDACDDNSGGGSDPYLTGNTGSETCSVWIDSDDDGVCDDADICEGGDDYIDTNQNGIPDACDDASGGNDPYLTGNTGNETCTPPWSDTDGDGICDEADVCEGADDLADSDSDYLPDACDLNGQGYLTGNVGTETCSVWVDGDNDGVCDDADVCQGADDYLDADGDGIPDGCDSDTQARIFQPERLIAQKTPGRKVKLTWAANETNAPTLYTIQHSTDGLHYTDLFTSSPRDKGKIEVYYDQHENPSVGNNFYRLKIAYLEKSSEYYEDEPLFFVPTGIAAFPNPTKDILHVNLSEIMGTSVIIKLHTIQGVELKTIEIDANHEEVVILNMRPYNNGLYTLTIQPDGFRAISQKVVISNTY